MNYRNIFPFARHTREITSEQTGIVAPEYQTPKRGVPWVRGLMVLLTLAGVGFGAYKGGEYLIQRYNNHAPVSRPVDKIAEPKATVEVPKDYFQSSNGLIRVALICPPCTEEEYNSILEEMKSAHVHNLDVLDEDTFGYKPFTSINLKDRKEVEMVLQWAEPGVWEHEVAHILQANLFDTSERWYAEGLANYSQTLYGAKSSPVQNGSVYQRCEENPLMTRITEQRGVEKGLYCGGRLVIENNILKKISTGTDIWEIYKSNPVLANAWNTGDLFFMLLEQRGLTVEKNQTALVLLKQMYKSRLDQWQQSQSAPNPEPISVHDIRRAYERTLDLDLGYVFSVLGPGIRNNDIRLTRPIEELLGDQYIR
ncbi:MAG: hypothetical protein HY361_02615 [Candidatus Aenigmarchaeota archaeon]|nr:hypothetical protein [Candidatus Aenigmarchaeota archaeon]